MLHAKLNTAIPGPLSHADAVRVRFPRRENTAERAARIQAIHKIHVNTDVVVEAKAKLESILTRLECEVDVESLAIVAPSGAGKTQLLRKLAEHPDLQPSVDAWGPVRPLVFIKAPAPCNLRMLGDELLKALTGQYAPSSYREPHVWKEAVAQLHHQLVSVVIIDEFHHTVLGRNTDERQKLVNTLKNRMIPDPADPLRPPGDEVRPIAFVLAGMRHMTATLKEDDQLWLRCLKHEILPLSSTKRDLAKAERFLELFEPKLGFPLSLGLTEPDMLRRLLVASNGYVGRIAKIVKGASYRAIMRGADTIDLTKDFAPYLEDLLQLGPKRNPFLVPDIGGCPRIKEHEFNRATLLRGKRPAGTETLEEIEDDEDLPPC